MREGKNKKRGNFLPLVLDGAPNETFFEPLFFKNLFDLHQHIRVAPFHPTVAKEINRIYFDSPLKTLNLESDLSTSSEEKFRRLSISATTQILQLEQNFEESLSLCSKNDSRPNQMAQSTSKKKV